MFTQTGPEVEEYAKSTLAKLISNQSEEQSKTIAENDKELAVYIFLAASTIAVLAGKKQADYFVVGSLWMYFILREIERLEMEKLANA